MKEVIELIEKAKSDGVVAEFLADEIAAAERWVAQEQVRDYWCDKCAKKLSDKILEGQEKGYGITFGQTGGHINIPDGVP